MNVRTAGHDIIKRLRVPSGTGPLLARTRALRRAGVATPAARIAGEGEIRFPRIRGTGGLDLIAARGEAALEPILGALARLHRASVDGLPAYRADAKIVSRLGADAPGWAAAALEHWLPAAPATGPVHGDFHARQVIRDARGQVWLLDLDDLAEGPREADLGNFAAHLATRPETRRGPAGTGLAHWLAAVLAAYPDGTDAALGDAYGRVALLRRGLKLAECGNRDVLAEVREALGF